MRVKHYFSFTEIRVFSVDALEKYFEYNKVQTWWMNMDFRGSKAWQSRRRLGVTPALRCLVGSHVGCPRAGCVEPPGCTSAGRLHLRAGADLEPREEEGEGGGACMFFLFFFS